MRETPPTEEEARMRREEVVALRGEVGRLRTRLADYERWMRAMCRHHCGVSPGGKHMADCPVADLALDEVAE